MVHGAFDRFTFGRTVIVLAPRFKPKPFLSESKVYMQTRLLTVVECVRVFAWSEALAIQVYYWRTAQHSIPAQHRHSTATAQHSHSTGHSRQPTAQHSKTTRTAQHSHRPQHSHSTATAQHSTAQRQNENSTAQHSTAHTTAQHSNSTAQRRTTHSTGHSTWTKGT